MTGGVAMPHRCTYRTAALLVLTFVSGLLGGCQTQEKRYTLRGRVVAKSPGTEQISVAGEKIPGFMAAMIMPYPVKDPQGLAAVEAGDQITADVVLKNDETYWLERV